ncbi:ribokinase [Dokdonella sp.]|uniref:ribokinase n=1 Tax=Dokdonella sp. TaxID=2291710 RepID=UPI0025BA46BB|nr:ribokinase [Dokdonella sp.]MBX3691804.1 ribokinase [Dokdonella sp.]MCW5569433.1 ribokinase [Dokdonella sp.]
MSSNRLEVVVVGSYVQDHVWLADRFPETGETLAANGFTTGPGGKGFNQAVACRRQDARVAFIGALGDDHLGAFARDFAAREALDARWQTCPTAPTAAASIAVDPRGANRILVNLAANLELEEAFVAAQADAFAQARVLLCQLENDLTAVRAALTLGGQHGLLRVLNPAPVHRDVDAALLEACDVITPNEHEFVQLLERLVGERVKSDDLGLLDQARLHALCRKLGVPTVVVTLGVAGCFVSHGEDTRGDEAPYYRVAAERVKAIDTVGAGDAFNGALAAALARNVDAAFKRKIRHANRVAALSTEKIGASIAMPTRADVVARFGEE